MRQAEGLVARVETNGKAQVMIHTNESVSGCASRTGHCHCSGGGAGGLTIAVQNRAGAQPGDYVSVGFVPGAGVKSVAVMLGIPFFGLMIGVIMGSILFQNGHLSSTGAVLAGAGFWALAILAAVVVYRRISEDIQPFTERIITKASGTSPLFETIDPVCKMPVDPQKADARMEYNGKTYFFCHAGCLNAFMKQPEKYLGHLTCAHC
jgi:YHS domain-containing protein/positive regulator of sigma E activity